MGYVPSRRIIADHKIRPAYNYDFSVDSTIYDP